MLYSVNSQYGKTGIAGRRERNVTPINKILDNAGKAAVVIRSALIVPVKTNRHFSVQYIYAHTRSAGEWPHYPSLHFP